MLFMRDLQLAERALDGYAARFQAAAHNLANIHTPGYQRRVVDFEKSLEAALEMSEDHIDPERPMDGPYPDSTHFLHAWQPSIRTVENQAQRIDGNNVSLEAESAYATRAAGKFNLLATWIAGEYRGLKFVIDAR